jgi:hypothetical protein
MKNIAKINEVIKNYFELNKSIKIIPAKELMLQFINAGIFNSNHRDGFPIRKVLRDLKKLNQLHLIPFAVDEQKTKNSNWFFRNVKFQPATDTFIKQNIAVKNSPVKKVSAKNRDEDYIIDLCDEILKLKGSRQHRFDFLLGDPGKNGKRAKLPVDLYYEELQCVIEFKEIQHTKPVKHFDKPDKLTVSGVHRGEQRKKYDALRATELPKHGIRLIEISYDDFECLSNKKIVRDKKKVREKLSVILLSEILQNNFND